MHATLFGGGGNVAYAFDVALDASSAPVVSARRIRSTSRRPPAHTTPRSRSQNSLNREWDAFVTRFNPTGIKWSSHVPGAASSRMRQAGGERGGPRKPTGRCRCVRLGHRRGLDLREFSDDLARMTGRSGSQLAWGGHDRVVMDAFIARFNPTGTQLTYSTHLGGQVRRSCADMVIDSQGVLTWSASRPARTSTLRTTGPTARRFRRRPMPCRGRTWGPLTSSSRGSASTEQARPT